MNFLLAQGGVVAKTKGLPIEVQAAATLILIQLAHKQVAELPGSMAIAGTAARHSGLDVCSGLQPDHLRGREGHVAITRMKC